MRNPMGELNNLLSTTDAITWPFLQRNYTEWKAVAQRRTSESEVQVSETSNRDPELENQQNRNSFIQIKDKNVPELVVDMNTQIQKTAKSL